MIKYIIKILLLFSSFFISASAQIDYVKWEKAKINYQISNEDKGKDFSFSGDNPVEASVKTLTNIYWFFISDVDGDNCSFAPSCSQFFVESVKETNIFQGTLMFFDRFTRDLNFYERQDHYPIKSGKFFDPPSLYQLDQEKILTASDMN